MSIPDFMSNLSKIRESVDRMQTELNNVEVTGTAGLGMATVTFHGNSKVTVNIEDKLLESGKSVIEEVVASAVLDAVLQQGRAKQQKMREIGKQFGLPNLDWPLV